MCSCKWEGEPKILPPRGVYFTDQIFKLQFHHNFTKYCLNTCIMTTAMLTQWHFLHEEWMSVKRNNLMDHTVTNFIFFFCKKWQSMQVIYWPRYRTSRLQWKSFTAKDLCLKKHCCTKKKCNCCYSFGFPSHILVCKITIPLNYLQNTIWKYGASTAAFNAEGTLPNR